MAYCGARARPCPCPFALVLVVCSCHSGVLVPVGAATRPLLARRPSCYSSATRPAVVPGGRAASRPLLVRRVAATRPRLVRRPCCYAPATRPATVMLLVRCSSSGRAATHPLPASVRRAPPVPAVAWCASCFLTKEFNYKPQTTRHRRPVAAPLPTPRAAAAAAAADHRSSSAAPAADAVVCARTPATPVHTRPHPHWPVVVVAAAAADAGRCARTRTWREGRERWKWSLAASNVQGDVRGKSRKSEREGRDERIRGGGGAEKRPDAAAAPVPRNTGPKWG